MKLSTLGAVTAALAVSAAAGAQTSRPYEPVGFSLRVGTFFPTNQSTNDEEGTAFLAFGADYDLDLRTPSFGGFRTGLKLSVDYYRRGDTGNIPLILNAVATKGAFSFQVGAGAGFATLPGGDKTVFTYDAGVIYTLPVRSTLPVFVQGNFYGSDFSRVNGFGLYAGVKF